MSSRIEEQTGLVIGAKSIRNYSLFAFGEGREPNPSIATLDTLARYVSEAPATDEVRRKTHESHYPYWFAYLERNGLQTDVADAGSQQQKKRLTGKSALQIAAVVGLLALATGFFVVSIHRTSGRYHVSENFTDVSEASLRANGWTVRDADTETWANRAVRPGHLTLYTIPGDNWRSERATEGMQNLVIRKVTGACWTTEIHLTDFYPSRNWEQAGLLIGEDPEFKGKFIRVSLAYNDFFGGYDKSPEIILQGVTSQHRTGNARPEEFAHVVLFTLTAGTDSLARANLAHSAIRVERNNDNFRILFASGGDVFAFREVSAGAFNIEATHIALFATQGLSANASYAQAGFDSFSFDGSECPDAR